MLLSEDEPGVSEIIKHKGLVLRLSPKPKLVKPIRLVVGSIDVVDVLTQFLPESLGE